MSPEIAVIASLATTAVIAQQQRTLLVSSSSCCCQIIPFLYGKDAIDPNRFSFLTSARQQRA
ncbi:MAG TPA: hypothetical protein PLD88_06290 [Candidatus Berkiella sp.]|nr:hypothetical protein [Candidatus Berkiella sp.]